MFGYIFMSVCITRQLIGCSVSSAPHRQPLASWLFCFRPPTDLFANCDQLPCARSSKKHPFATVTTSQQHTEMRTERRHQQIDSIFLVDCKR